ncbi:endonuclease domain-containing protein [Microbacterium sp. 22179]|uniref:endonuclease domain-containing protein n=1 Tax=Microbacterium sp. 22179 TaxID=3453886 RepID=UPI003F857389
MLPPAHLIERLGGVARGSLLQRYGVPRHALADAVSTRRILRVRQGVFATPQTSAAIVTAAAHGGAVTCTAALRMHGVWCLEDDPELHVWLGAKGRVHHVACDCVSHWHAGATVFGVAPLDEVLLHLYRCRGDEAFFSALESALRQRKVTSLARLRSKLPASARWLVDLARTDADSGLESLLRLRLHILGIRLECQISITGVGRVDFVIGGRLILEADGAEHHDGRAARHRDLRRDAAASALGYESLRFDYALIVRDWPVVSAAIVSALVRMGGTR